MSDFHGYLCIINIENGRQGTDHDIKNLDETFRQMGAEVETLFNPDINEIKKKMTELKGRDFSEYTYVAIAYLSHGEEDGFAQVQGGIERVERHLYIPLRKNDTLNKKLKWLIMGTCRGEYDCLKDDSEGKSNQESLYYLKSYATSEGLRALRHDDTGSVYIVALCSRLKEYFQKKDLVKIIEEANADTKRLCVELHRSANQTLITQRPWIDTNLGTLTFYIKSGISDG